MSPIIHIVDDDRSFRTVGRLLSASGYGASLSMLRERSCSHSCQATRSDASCLISTCQA